MMIIGEFVKSSAVFYFPMTCELTSASHFLAYNILDDGLFYIFYVIVVCLNFGMLMSILQSKLPGAVNEQNVDVKEVLDISFLHLC